MIAAASFVGISYLVGNAVFADYLQIHFVPGTGELAVICGAVIGAGLGFLWFNAPPASIFMGDTGSLALGGLLGSIAVATKHEIVLAIVGGLFVLEAVSVIVQVVSFKLHRQARVPDGADPSSLRAARLDRAADRDPLLDHLGGAGARRPLDAEAAMIATRHQLSPARRSPCSGSAARGWRSAQALLAGGAEVIGVRRQRRAASRKAHGGRHRDRGSAHARLVEGRRAGAGARRAADPSGAALDASRLAQRAGVEVIGDIELFCRERAQAARRMRRSSPSPAPTASRPPPR